MKTAKEWAASVISEPAFLDQCMWNVSLRDEQTPPGISLIEPSDEDDARDLCDDARAIIERLVERAQANARAPLEAEIARLKTRNDYVEGMIGAYEGVIAAAADGLSKALEPGADTAGYVREVATYLKGLTTL